MAERQPPAGEHEPHDIADHAERPGADILAAGDGGARYHFLAERKQRVERHDEGRDQPAGRHAGAAEHDPEDVEQERYRGHAVLHSAARVGKISECHSTVVAFDQGFGPGRDARCRPSAKPATMPISTPGTTDVIGMAKSPISQPPESAGVPHTGSKALRMSTMTNTTIGTTKAPARHPSPAPATPPPDGEGCSSAGGVVISKRSLVPAPAGYCVIFGGQVIVVGLRKVGDLPPRHLGGRSRRAVGRAAPTVYGPVI